VSPASLARANKTPHLHLPISRQPPLNSIQVAQACSDYGWYVHDHTTGPYRSLRGDLPDPRSRRSKLTRCTRTAACYIFRPLRRSCHRSHAQQIQLLCSIKVSLLLPNIHLPSARLFANIAHEYSANNKRHLSSP